MKAARTILQKCFEAADTARAIWSKKQQLNFSCFTFTGLEIFSSSPGILVVCFVLIYLFCLTWEKQIRLLILPTYEYWDGKEFQEDF